MNEVANDGNGGSGMSAVLKHSVSGNPYVSGDLQGFAGKEVKVEKVEILITDKDRGLKLVVHGHLRLHSLPLAYFQCYPPLEVLRRVAVIV